MAAVGEFARLWWNGKPQALEGIVVAVLVLAVVVVFLDWPLWAVLAVWFGVQVVAMAVWAGWQVATGTAEGGEGGG
jgi:uncharacterized membrane protein